MPIDIDGYPGQSLHRDDRQRRRGRISWWGVWPVGTHYIAYDGDRSTDPSRGSWMPRGFGPVIVQGMAVGGTTQVFIDQSPDALTVAESSANLAPQLAAGVAVDIHYPWWRCRIVQSGADATQALIMLTLTEGRPGMARYTSTTVVPVGTNYMRATDGSWTTNANDGSTWVPRQHRSVLVQGLTVGGASTVSLEWASKDDNGAYTVRATTPITQLQAGQEVDEAAGWVRVKCVQATAPTTSQLLVLTT